MFVEKGLGLLVFGSCSCTYQQMGILFAHARDESNILCSAPFVSFERAAAGF